MRSTVSSRGMDGRELLVRAMVTVGVIVALVLVLASVRYRWSFAAVWGKGGYAGVVLGGLVTTVWVSLASLLLALFVGFLGGLARLSRRPVVHQLGTIYVELVRGTPLLVQIVVAYYCVAPAVSEALRRLGAATALVEGVQDPVVVGVVSLGVFAGAYVAEIVRAAVESVDPGQTEAALSQGMTRGQALRFVLLPQAIRRMIPPLTGQLVSLVKDSSLLSVIAVGELLKRTSEVSSTTYKTFEVYLPAALLYLVVTFTLSQVARRLELRLT
jgi:polar amino acid transport system permease protein